MRLAVNMSVQDKLMCLFGNALLHVYYAAVFV